MQLGDLGTHGNAQLGVQVGQRLVKEEHLRLTDDGTAQSNALALAAGQSLGLAVEQVGNIEDLGSLFHALLDLRLGGLAQLEAEGHVVKHGHVRIQGVVLEHHGDVAVLGSHIVDQTVADIKLAAGDFLQTGHHAQRGGLAAAGRSDQHDELLVLNVQAEIADSGHIAGINLIDVIERYACHSQAASFF